MGTMECDIKTFALLAHIARWQPDSLLVSELDQPLQAEESSVGRGGWRLRRWLRLDVFQVPG
jgi:hypothetical protein